MKKSSVQIDGWLYFLTALGAAFLTYFSTEESYKYVPVTLLFWLKAIIGSLVSAINGLKAFRSMTFGRFVQAEQVKEDEKKASGNTQFLTKQNEKNPPVNIGG